MHYEKFADGSAKCIEDEIPFDLPAGWAWARLISLTTKIGAGSTPTGGSAVYSDSGVKFIRSQNVYDDGLALDDVAYISESINQKKAGSIVKAKDILLNITGGSIGRCALVPDDFDIANVNQHVIIIRLIDAGLRHYLHSVIISPYIQEQIFSKQVGSGRGGLSAETLSTFLIPVPPIQEQSFIQEKMNQCVSNISIIVTEKNEITSLVAAARSKILDLAICGQLVPQDPNDEPASVLLERIRAEKEELIKQGKIKRDKKDSVIFRGEDNSYYEKVGNELENIEMPFALPDGWAWAHLSNLVLILNGDRGQNYPAKSKLQNEGIPFVSASNIENGIVSYDNLLCLSELQYEALGAGKLLAGDIIYCIRGSLGKSGIFAMEKGAIASSLVIVRSVLKEVCITDYIFVYLNSAFAGEEIKKYDNGSAQPNLAAKDFMRFLVPVPPLDEQKAICTKLKTMFALIQNVEKILS